MYIYIYIYSGHGNWVEDFFKKNLKNGVFLDSFNLWRLLLIIAIYHHTKTPINFLCRRELNPKSLIQPSEILPVELIGTH